MWALIQGGLAAEIVDVDPAGRYHPSLIWRECPDGTPIGARLQGNIFLPPKEPTLDELKAAKLIEINRSFDIDAAQLTAGYPTGEQMTWDVQRVEAMAWAADQSAPTPYLDGLATARGLGRDDMLTRTVGQTQMFLAASQMFVGKRQRLSDRIAAATDKAQVGSIVW